MQINPEIVATDIGSLPQGDSEANTPIFAIGHRFTDSEGAPAHSKVDLSWEDKIAFYVDGVLSPAECRSLIALTEDLGFRAAAPGIRTPPGMRQNTTVHWFAEPEDVAAIHQRIAPLLPATIDDAQLMDELSQRFNTYRYTQGQQFRPHLDGDWPGFNLDNRRKIQTWPLGHSKLSMLLYLNGTAEGVLGGDTLLLDANRIKHRITPKAGRALFFRHGIHEQSVLHAGDLLLGDTPKYVVRINVMYRRQ